VIKTRSEDAASERALEKAGEDSAADAARVAVVFVVYGLLFMA